MDDRRADEPGVRRARIATRACHSNSFFGPGANERHTGHDRTERQGDLDDDPLVAKQSPGGPYREDDPGDERGERHRRKDCTVKSGHERIARPCDTGIGRRGGDQFQHQFAGRDAEPADSDQQMRGHDRLAPARREPARRSHARRRCLRGQADATYGLRRSACSCRRMRRCAGSARHGSWTRHGHGVLQIVGVRNQSTP